MAHGSKLPSSEAITRTFVERGNSSIRVWTTDSSSRRSRNSWPSGFRASIAFRYSVPSLASRAAAANASVWLGPPAAQRKVTNGPERRSWRYGCSWQKGLPAPHLALEQNGLTGFGERLCSADHFLHGPTGMVDILKAAVGQIAVEPVAFPQSPGTLPLYLVHLVKENTIPPAASQLAMGRHSPPHGDRPVLARRNRAPAAGSGRLSKTRHPQPASALSTAGP